MTDFQKCKKVLHSKNELYEYEQKTWNRREETEKMGEQYENFYLVFFNLLTPPSYMLQAAEIM